MIGGQGLSFVPNNYVSHQLGSHHESTEILRPVYSGVDISRVSILGDGWDMKDVR